MFYKSKHIAEPVIYDILFILLLFETKADWYQFSRNSAYCASSINLTTKKNTDNTHN